ncbi:polar amino acid transport system substrate-binding protein [Chitinivorax tropicus]|uniref:Polar amino acid transport system substrate-binding protein n=1 Tax=Chitinivorax tropicus TaxID=714531 RepID=A0A840MMD7_9PROT|nr:basic amino acid ABC transporter substrate-binding protein [Chitinivorax tropicus]MBB5018289.1 polar amino acid transport system substrate-binding protein [Chitinivorax tropicus]
MNKLSSKLLAALIAGALVLSACGKKEEQPATPPAAQQSDAKPAEPAKPAVKELVVGTDAAYAPFESENENKEIVGFDIDVVKAIAEKAGVQVKFVNTPWEGIFKTLDQGDRDLLVSAITITDERKQSMDFSEPYFEAKQLIAVSSNSKVQKLEDLKKLKVGVQTGTTGDEVVQKLQGKTSPNIKRFESTPLALKELEAGGVDAVVADNGVVINYVKNNSDKGFRMVEDATFAKEFYGLAVKKGNAELVAKLNEGLKKIKEDGTYDKIYAQYFAETKAAAPAEAAKQ